MTYRGFSLVEVLVATVIGGVVVLGSIESLRFSMQAGAVSKAILTENDFRLTINKALDENCTDNLGLSDESKKLTAKDVKIPVESLSFRNESVITVGPFKDSIEVVKMEVKTEGVEDTRPSDFTVYYKKTNLGDLNTVAGGDCDATVTPQKLSGCFTKKCRLNYSFTADTPKAFDSCKVLNCHDFDPSRVALSGYPCPWGYLYNPDHKTTNKPKCEDRNKKIAGQTTCDGVPSEKALGQGDNQRNKVVDPNDPDKCICRGGYGWDANIGVLNRFLLTAEGLCFGNFGHEHCMRVDNTQFKKYCSRDYQGSRECVKQPTSGGGTIYYKRVYNRETGGVVCIGSEGQKVRVHRHREFLKNNSDYTSDNPSTPFFTIPPPPSWFMPQVQ